MKGKRQKKNPTGAVIFGLGALIIIVFIAVFAFNKLTEKKPETFAIVYDGQKIASDVKLEFYADTDIRFDVGEAYSLAIKANDNTENTFYFSVGGEPRSFFLEPDLLAGFKLLTYDDYFVLTIDKKMPQILAAVYPDVALDVPNKDYSTDFYFLIVITSAETGEAINIEFRALWGIRGLTLDRDHIVF